MRQPLRATLVQVLDACRQTGVFHPRVDAALLGLDRAAVDAALDQLRLGGFVEIADWAADRGQGYRLTEAGAEALANPARLERPAPPPVVVSHPVERTWERGAAIVETILHPRRPRVTPILIGLNLAVFALGAAMAVIRGGSIGDFLMRGSNALNAFALVPSAVVAGNEWWRLITYAFLHGNIIHLGFNMYALNSLGGIMEARWGMGRFLLLYLGSAVLAGVAVLFFGDPNVPTVGASGGICGLLTSIGIWAWMHRQYLPPEFVQAHYRTVGINLVLLVFMGTMMPNVSNEAHAGGAFAGAILSIPLAWMDRHSSVSHRLFGAASILGLAIAVSLAVGVVLIQSPRFEGAAAHVEQERLLREGERLLHPALDADARIIAFFKKNIEPVLKAGPDAKTAETLGPRLVEAAIESRRIAAEIRDRIPNLKGALARDAKIVQGRFTERAEFFDRMQDFLERPDRWPDNAVRAKLRESWPPPLLPGH